jgi:hypothetical protein
MYESKSSDNAAALHDRNSAQPRVNAATLLVWKHGKRIKGWHGRLVR